MKILFSSHLSGKAEDWYDNLEVEEKSSWPTLVKRFQTYYQLVPRDTRTKLFNLKMRLADFQQQTEENIADYLERAANLVTKFPTEEFDISMATVRGINDREHQGWIERECHRTADFMVKVSYTKIGQPDPFDSSVRHTPKLHTTANGVQVQNELLQQLFSQQCLNAARNSARNENHCQRQYASE